MEPSSLRFARAVRAVAAGCRAEGLQTPAFRNQPGGGAARTIRRRPDGGSIVAVALQDRPWSAVLADLVDGVLAANALTGPPAVRARAALWSALATTTDEEGAAA